MILTSILLIALFLAGLGMALMHLGVAVDSPWLLAHIVSAMAAYGLFAMAVLCACGFALQERRLRQLRLQQAKIPLLTLEQWLFACVYAGFGLLTLSLLLGAVAGGAGFLLRPQHKTIFAVLAWGCFGALVLGRLGFGWRGKQAVRMVLIGCAFLVLAYVGTHFVLQVVLQRT